MKLNPKFVSPIAMWLIVAAGVAASIFFLPDDYLFEQGPVSWAILGAGITNWLYLFVLAFSVHRQAPRSASAIDKLITEGVYGYIRHPMYVGYIVLAWTVAIAFSRADFVIGAMWLTLVQLFWMQFEEQALEQKFMDDYRAYRSSVPMLLPRFTKRLALPPGNTSSQ